MTQRPPDPDEQLFDRVNALAAEEEQLYATAADGHGMAEDEVSRLREVETELNRLYDLLHQRQGRRDAGQDPSSAEVRPVDIVEHYRQ